MAEREGLTGRERLVWNAYCKLRKELSQGSLEGKADKLRKCSPTQASGRRQACDVCGVSFQRRDPLLRHPVTAKHQEHATGYATRRPGGGGSRARRWSPAGGDH
ncbi:MAG TPA: hypothetical protein VFF67_09990 [Thermoplasmata archaeon]|nr:hypothetical protein [Thermoplasmata archaeon]